jgi:hypothetical protein
MQQFSSSFMQLPCSERNRASRKIAMRSRTQNRCPRTCEYRSANYNRCICSIRKSDCPGMQSCGAHIKVYAIEGNVDEAIFGPSPSPSPQKGELGHYRILGAVLNDRRITPRH